MKVKVSNIYCEWFEMKTGVRKREPSSTILFSVVLDSVTTSLEVRGNIMTRLEQICAYEDEIVIFGRTKRILIDIFCKLKYEVLHAGLKVNTKNEMDWACGTYG